MSVPIWKFSLLSPGFFSRTNC